MYSYIGEIRAFAFGFAPDGDGENWLICNGATLQVLQFPALYAVIGYTYGTAGPNTFCLPNLMGRAIIGSGSPTDAPAFEAGQMVGATSVTVKSVPAHSHTLTGAVVARPPYPGLTATPSPTTLLSRATRRNPQNPASPGTFSLAYAPDNPEKTNFLAGATLTPVVGTAQPHENRQPYLALTYCICAYGAYPLPPTPPAPAES